MLCPRNCGVNRKKQIGACGVSGDIIVSYVMLHHFEEPIISGEKECDIGSGAIFFAGCSLKCEFCQNYDISHSAHGYKISTQDLANVFKQLESMGAFNINLVTPTHYADKIIEALKIYKPKIPIVWNTSGYEKPETIEMLRGFVDVFLTDLKYFSEEVSKLSCASDYFKYASASAIKMRDVVGKDVIENGIIKRGVVIRHLVLPNFTQDSVNILSWIAENMGRETIVSIMNQYVPMFGAKNNPKINRKVSKLEYKRVVNKALALGLNNAYIQDDDSASESYTPNFEATDNLLFKFGIVKLN